MLAHSQSHSEHASDSEKELSKRLVWNFQEHWDFSIWWSNLVTFTSRGLGERKINLNSSFTSTPTENGPPQITSLLASLGFTSQVLSLLRVNFNFLRNSFDLGLYGTRLLWFLRERTRDWLYFEEWIVSCLRCWIITCTIWQWQSVTRNTLQCWVLCFT